MKKLITIVFICCSLFSKGQVTILRPAPEKPDIVFLRSDTLLTITELVKQNDKFSKRIDTLEMEVWATKFILRYIMSFVSDEGIVIDEESFRKAVIDFKKALNNARKHSEFQ